MLLSSACDVALQGMFRVHTCNAAAQDEPHEGSDAQDKVQAAAYGAHVNAATQTHGHHLLGLPAEVLFSIIDQLDISALACFAQSSKDLRSMCMIDAVWDRLTNRKVPTASCHLQPYHKPKPSITAAHDSKPALCSSASRITTPEPVSQAAPAASHVQASPNSLSQRYAFLDDKLKLQYCGRFVQQPAWLSLLPNVTCQGAGWLYAKAKSLSGAHCCRRLPSNWFS